MLARFAITILQAVLLLIALTINAYADAKNVSLRLQWKHQFEFAGFYAAKELGYYSEAGLNVNLLEYQNGVDLIAEVTSGEVDFGIWGSGIIERGMQGDPIVFLANYFKRSPLVLATRPEISFPSELQGKTLMVSSSDISSANYTQMFRTFKVDTNTINFVPPSFNTQAFEEGQVDGVSIFLTNEPYLLKKNGVSYNIIDPNNFGVELYDVNLFTSKQFLDSDPQSVDAFIEASNRGWAYAIEHPEQIVDLILEKYNSQHKSRDHLVYEAQQTVRMVQARSYEIGSIDKDQVNRIANLFTEVGLADRTLATDFVYTPFTPQVELTDAERAYLTAYPEAKVAMMPDFTPFSFINGNRPQGFEHDILKLISKNTGLRFVPEYGIWNRGLSAFQAREVDMIASISYKEERTSFTAFTAPYYEIPIMIYVRDDFGNYEGLDSLNGKRVGILKDVFYAKELAALGTMELVIFETYDELTKALVYGQVDALMQNLTNIDALIRENAYTNLRLAGELQLPSIKKEDLRFGVRSDRPLLHAIVEKGLESISDEEKFALANRWLGIKAKDNVDAVSFNRLEREYLEQKGPIKMCVDPDWMPLESIDANGQHTGISAEIFTELVNNTGLNIQLVPTQSWQETLTTVQQRRCDFLSLAMKTPSRLEYLDFTLPYLSYPFVIATLDHQQFIDNLSILNGKKLAMIKGFSTVELVASRYPEIEIVEVDSIAEGIKLVRSEQVFGYVDALPAMASTIQHEGMTDIYIAGKLEEEFVLSIATRNDEPLLQAIMQKALSSVKPDQIQAINNKWLAVRFESRVDYSLLYKVIFAFFVIGLLLLWRQRVMHKTRLLIEEKNRQLEKLAMTDMLTGLYNRHKVDEALVEQLDLSARYNTAFAVMLLDIDHFKRINDNYGHNVGDSTLVEFAKIIRAQTRKSDIVGRWGGEEFLIVVPQADKVMLQQMAENLRLDIAAHNFRDVGQVTTSIGLAMHRKGESINELVSRADTALYESKQSGRNRVSIAP